MPRYRSYTPPAEIFLALGSGGFFALFLLGYYINVGPKMLGQHLANRFNRWRIERRCEGEGEHRDLCTRVFSQKPAVANRKNPLLLSGDPESKADCAKYGAKAQSFCVKEADGTYVAWWEATAARPYIEEFCDRAETAYVTCAFAPNNRDLIPWWEPNSIEDNWTSTRFDIAFGDCLRKQSRRVGDRGTRDCPMGDNGYLVPRWATAEMRDTVIRDCAATQKPLVYCHRKSVGEYVPYWEHYGAAQIDVSSNAHLRMRAREEFANCAEKKGRDLLCKLAPNGAYVPFWAMPELREKKEKSSTACKYADGGNVQCRWNADGELVYYTELDPPYGPF